MNIVQVAGGKVKERQLIEEVACWCVQKLMPRYRTLDITIKIKNITGAYGYCVEGDHNREFFIEIQKGLTLYHIISTVCHEMVHVRQYVKGELGHRTDGSQLWKAEPELPRNTPYRKQPWEIEAFDLEAELAFECFGDLQYSF